MDKSTHEMRLMKWTAIIKECRSSGKTVTAWCSENNISSKSFYYWQRKVRNTVFDTMKDTKIQSNTKFVQLPAPIDSSIDTPSFKANMILHVGNNILELSNSTSENLLSTVLKVITNVK